MEVMYISYQEAQRLIPLFQELSRSAPIKEARESAKRILPELKLVREDISYSPLKGRQVFLRNELDKQFLLDSIGALELR